MFFKVLFGESLDIDVGEPGLLSWVLRRVLRYCEGLKEIIVHFCSIHLIKRILSSLKIFKQNIAIPFTLMVKVKTHFATHDVPILNKVIIQVLVGPVGFGESFHKEGATLCCVI